MTDHIAIIGGGLVGSGWAIIFARAGKQVKIYDSNPDTAGKALSIIGQQLEDLKSYGLIDNVEAILGRMDISQSLEGTVIGASYVQESVLETIEAKIAISHAISEHLDGNAIVGSSTSGIPASEFTENLSNRERFLVSHPVNPPYICPVVEVVPAPWTSDASVQSTIALMGEVGQAPVLVRREIDGFVLNRLQGVLLREAWALYEEGYASIEDIDKTISEGLGMRWSFMGPFETIDLNAPNGVGDYGERFGGLFHGIQESRKNTATWSKELIGRVEAERRQKLPAEDLTERRNWRDRRLMALAAHRKTQGNT